MFDAAAIIEQADNLPEGEELWIRVRAKNEQEALKVRLWRFLKSWKRQGDFIISLRTDPEGHPCVVLRKCDYEVCVRGRDGSFRPIDIRLESLRRRLGNLTDGEGKE